MSNKILNKVNNDIFSYETTDAGGVFKMSRVMPTEIHHSTAGVGTYGYILTSTGNGWSWTDPATLSSGSSLTDVNVTSPSTGEILAYDGSNWINNGNIKSLTGILNSTNYNYINITDTTPATVTIDYSNGSITDRHASLIVEGGVIVKAGPTSDDTVGSNPRVYSFISEGEGFFRGGLELENGMTLFSGDITDLAYGNIYQRGVKIGNTNLDLEGKSLTLSNGLIFQSGLDSINVCNINASGDGVNGGIIEMFTKDINGNLTKKISINSTGSVGIGTSPSYGNSGDVLTSQGGGAPPIWAPVAAPEAGGGDITSNSQIIKPAVETSSQYWGNPSWYETETNILAYYDFTKTAGWLDTGTAVDMGPNKNDITYVADYGSVEIITHGCIYDLNANNYVSGTTWTDSVGNKEVSLGTNIQHYNTGTKHYFDIPFADFMTITNHFKLGYTFTIEIILRPHATNGWHQIFTGEGYRGASYTGFAIWLNGAILELYHHPNSTDVNDVTLIGQFGTLSNDTWAHLVVAKDITGYHVYINGSSAGTSTTMATANYDSPNHQIGYPYPTNGGNYGFDGDIAVFRVYGNKMSTTEVTSQYVEYSTSEGGWGTSASSPVSFLATNNIRNDMKLTLGSTYTGTIAMGCWVKLFHGSSGYSTSFPNKNPNWSGIMAYGTTQDNGHFFCRGGIARYFGGGGTDVDQNMWDFGIGCESIGDDAWSFSSIGSQKVWDYITAQPDYQNRWWCWQARLTATGRLETSLDGSPFAIVQQARGDAAPPHDLINTNNSPTPPEIRIGCDGHLDNVANNSYGAMFWYRTSEYTDDMALDFYNTFKDKFKPAVSRSNILAYYNQVASPLSGATMTDLGPYGNDGTVSGAVAANGDSLEWTGMGQIDTGITFQHILDSNGTGEFTVAAKFQYTGTDEQTYTPIFGSDAELRDTNFFIGKNSGNTYLGLEDGPGSYQPAFITSPGIFDITGRESSHTIVVTRSGTPGSYIIRVYIDGVYGNKMNYVGTSPLSHKILIGYEDDFADFLFRGKIWQAIVLDKVLPSGEIQALHRVMTEDGQYLPPTVQFYSPTGIAIDSDLSVWNEDNPTTYSSGNDGDVLTSQGLGKPPKWTGVGLGGLTDVTFSPLTPTANMSFDFRNATIDTATKKVSINGTIVGEIKQDTAGNLETTQSATDGLVGSLSEYFSFDPKWALRDTAQSSVTIEIYFKMLHRDGNYFNGIFAAYNSATQHNESTMLNNFQIERNSTSNTIQFWTGDVAEGYSHNLRTTTPSVGMQGVDFEHLVCIYDGVNGKKSVYMNGVISEVEGGSNGDGTYNYFGPYTQMIIGRTPWTNDNDVEYIRFFRHYDRVLTAEEIEVLYNARDTTTTPTEVVGDGEIIAYDTSTNKWVNTNILNSISTTTFFNINSPLQLVGQTGTTGQVLSVASDGNPEWTTPSAGVSNPKVYGSIWCDGDYVITGYTLWGGENANPISSDNNSPGYDFVNSHPNMWINPDPNNEYYWHGKTGNGNVLLIPRDGHYHITIHQLVYNSEWNVHTITRLDMWIGRFRPQQYWNPGWTRWNNQVDIIGEYRSYSSAADQQIHARATATIFCRAGDRIFGQFYNTSTGGTIVGDASNPSGISDVADGYSVSRSSGFSVFSID